MLNFQSRALDNKLLNFTQIETIKLISKNVSFNESSFAKSETVIGFVTS